MNENKINDAKEYFYEKEFYTVRGYQLLEQHKTTLTPSLEDYLEMIYRSMKKDGHVRVNTLARHLNVQPSSASKMIVKLARLGFIEYEKYGIMTLTQQGMDIGQYLLWRHNVVERFLQLIAQENKENIFIEAELIEHILSKNTVESMDKLFHFLNDNKEIIEEYNNYDY